MVQTVGGGVMGLVIAQLILWWMPGNWAKENRDPFGMAPKVEVYAPFVVPTALRGNAPTAQADRAAAAPGAGTTRATKPTVTRKNAGTKSSTDRDSNIPDFTFDGKPPAQNTEPRADRNSKNKEKKETAANSEEFPLGGLNEPITPDKAPAPVLDPLAPPTNILDPPSPPAKTKDDKGQAQPPVDPAGVSTSVAEEKSTKEKPVGEANASAVKAADITDRLTDVASAERAWDTAENPTNQQKLELMTNLYLKLSQLGDAVARTGESQAEAAELLQPVVEKLQAVAVQPEKLVPLGKLAGMRLKDDRNHGGLVVGIVLSHQPRGKMFETQLRLLAKSDPVVTIVSRTDLGEQLRANTNVLVLGRWVSTPADNLAGYEGDAESVLSYGVHVTVPTASPPP
jgi:hypothetical protein